MPEDRIAQGPTITKVNLPKLNPKNIFGDLGEICNYCSGLGFTNNLNGSSAGCHRCDQTGIEPVNTRELAKEVEKLDSKMDEILRLLKKN